MKTLKEGKGRKTIFIHFTGICFGNMTSVWGDSAHVKREYRRFFSISSCQFVDNTGAHVKLNHRNVISNI